MLPSLALSLCFGLLFGSLLPYFPLTSSILLLLALTLSVWGERRHNVPPRVVTACIGSMLAGIIVWTLAAQRMEAGSGLDAPVPDFPVEITGRIVAPVQQGTDRLVLLVAPEASEEMPQAPKRVRLTWRMPERLVFQGDRVRFHSKVRRPSGSLNPGGFDYAAYLERQGVDAVATVLGPSGVGLVESGSADARWAIWNRVDRWRGSIRLAAIQSLSQPALGIFLGVVIGDRGYLDADLRDLFMVTGTVHLLSISGSHLGLVAILFFMAVKRLMLRLPSEWLLRLSRRQTPTRIAALLTVIPVSLYAVVAGAEVATVRSLTMILAALLARWLGHDQRIFHALALAAILILLHDPMALYDISFQLSFLSVWAIAAWMAHPREAAAPLQPPSRWNAWLMWGGEAILISAVITLITLPLTAYYFNQVAWLGLFTNIVAVPIMGLCLVPMGLLASIGQLALGENTLPFGNVIQWSMEAFTACLALANSVPGGEWHVAAPSILLMCVFYGFLVVAWWGGNNTVVRWSAAVAGLCIVAWWLWSPRLAVDGDRFRVTFLDVGQGDSAVVELPDGQVVLVDGGATFERFDMGRGVVGPYLWNRGIRALDHVIGTHPQLDHVGGLAWIIRHFPVRHYWSIGEQREEGFYQRLREALTRQHVTEQIAYEGMELTESTVCRMVVLNPSKEQPAVELVSGRRREGHRLNNRSLVSQLTCGSHDILFCADVESEALSRILADRHHHPVEVVKVPHHGAMSSLQREWIADAHPQYAIFSAGKHNAYGHPATPVIDAYRAIGSQILRTDRDGGIWLVGTAAGSALTLHRTTELAWQPVPLTACGWPCERGNWNRTIEQWRQRW